MANRPRKSGHHVDDDDDDGKFPTGQMVTLAICKFSEPIAFNSVIAYTFPMAKYLHDGDDTNASFYAGLLVSAYAFGEVFTAVIWGSISDRIGRKPVVLAGLCGVAFSCIMFGLAQSYWVALLARLIGGMLNGNVAVMQTMLAEMVKRPEHEPTAYAIHPFVWFAGGILGSAMGGWLSQPAEQYPKTFSPDGVFAKYPYLLPNLVCVVAIAIAVIQGMVFLKETNPMLLAKAKSRALSDQTQVDETTPLRRTDRKQMDSAVDDCEESSDQEDGLLHRKPSMILEDGLTSTTDPPFDLRRSSFGTMHTIRTHQPIQPEDFTKPDLRTTFNFTVVMLITSLVICSYHSMGYGNMLPIYLLDKPQHLSHLDLSGGLGYNLHAVGSFMAINGFIAVVVQAVVFPPFVSRIGVWRSWLSCMLFYPFTYAFIPFLTALAPGTSRSIGIYTLMLVQNFLNIIIPPCALILIKNATPSMLVLGTVNGACMSIICFARTIAPPVEGIIYGAGGSAAMWWSLTGVSVVAAVQIFYVPRPKAETEEVEVEGPGFRRKDNGEAVLDDDEMVR